MNDVAIRESGSVMVLPEQVDLIRRTVAKDASKDELELYFYDCKRQGVHPLDKLIHFTKRGGRYVPITSIDFLRMKAGATKEYAGSDDAVYVGTPGSKGFEAKVAVYRMVQGQRCAWAATARWEEYFPGEQQGHMWKKMPHVMLAKCAEALALRKAFADVLHGLYIREEMDQAEPTKDTRSLREKVQAKLVTIEPEPEGAAPTQPASSESGAEASREAEAAPDAPSNIFTESSAVADWEAAIEALEDTDTAQKTWDQIVKDGRVSSQARAGLYKKYQAKLKALRGGK